MQCTLLKHNDGEHQGKKGLRWSMGQVESVFLHQRQKIAQFREYPLCFYCRTQTTKPLRQTSGVPLVQPPTTLTEDHYIPRSRGGAVGSGNKVHACLACNFSKGNRMPDEWYATERYEGANRG